MRDYVGRTYQINIVAASYLEGKHYISELFAAYYATITQLAYGVVLAVDALEIAVGKENSA